MIITSLLTTMIIWCLFYKNIELLPLCVLSILFGIGLGCLGRHNHNGLLSIDAVPQRSKLNQVNPLLKTLVCLALLMISICSGVYTGLLLTFTILMIQLNWGKLSLQEYFSLLFLPLNFLLLSSLALLFEWTSQPLGVLNLKLFESWLSINVATQERTAIVLSRSLGALSSLYLLSLSTPLHEIIHVLQRGHVPSVVIDLMYLIHRYLFLLLELYHTMKSSAKSRLGFEHYSNSIRSTGMIYANLLISSIRRASVNFDAMESRCFHGSIRFLEIQKPITISHLVMSTLLLTFVASVALWEAFT